MFVSKYQIIPVIYKWISKNLNQKYGDQSIGLFYILAYSYPKKPNATTKRKYYDLILNLPLLFQMKK